MLFGLEHQRNPVHPPADACADTDEACRPYRIDVFATDVVSAVTHAGGWLYDQAARGLRVTVIASDTSDCRPLRILGVDVVGLDSACAADGGPRAHLLKTATELLKSDPHVEQLVLSGFSHSHSDIAVWGQKIPRRATDVAWVPYRLGPAASAFKRQALLATTVDPATSDVTEEFWCAPPSSTAPTADPPSRR